jgi:hypothetical protein
MQMDRRVEAGNETGANCYVKGFCPSRYAFSQGSMSFGWSTINLKECVSCHLYLSIPDESFNLIVLRHVTNSGVRVLVPFPVPPLVPRALFELPYGEHTVLHTLREWLFGIKHLDEKA